MPNIPTKIIGSTLLPPNKTLLDITEQINQSTLSELDKVESPNIVETLKVILTKKDLIRDIYQKLKEKVAFNIEHEGYLFKSSEQTTEDEAIQALSFFIERVIKNSMQSIPLQEQNARKYLDQDFFAKTITGFASPKAWQQVTKALTLKDKKEKAPFRNPKQLNKKPFRVRLNPTTNQLEIHDARDKSQSLHKDIKEQREKEGLLPLPPHHSWTYYDVNDKTFRPDFFSSRVLSDTQSKEIIGIRVSTKDALVNRILPHDSGTNSVSYGFATKQEAEQYLRNNQHQWPKTFDELKKLQNTNYNEVMVRANWRCDGSSQVVIYPPNDPLSGRYAAILYRMDLENYLREHSDVYSKPPVGWFDKYHVPISFWGNNLGAPSLYTLEEQEKDLKKNPKSLREKFLKFAILFQRGERGEIFKELQKELTQAFFPIVKYSQEIVDTFGLMDFVNDPIPGIYAALFDEVPIENILHFIDYYKNYGRLNKLIYELVQLIAKRNILEYKDNVNIFLWETFTWACQNGHTEIVKSLIDAAVTLKETTPADNTLQQMLLAEAPGYGLANAFLWACQKGHTEIVKSLIDAAVTLKETTPADNTLQQMLLVGNKNIGLANGLHLALAEGHLNSVRVIVNSALQDIPLLEQFLSFKKKKLNTCIGENLKDEKPEHIAQILGACSLKSRKLLLNILNRALSPDKKADMISYLTNKIVEKVDTRIAKGQYISHAGFFSATRIKIKHRPEEQVKKVVLDRVKRNFKGASMLTLIDLINEAPQSTEPLKIK